VAVHIFLEEDGKVLLLRRYNTGYEDGNYSVVAGHVEHGETVRQAAAREMREEIGLVVAPENLDVVGVMHRRSNDERVDFFLTVRSWSGEVINRETDRCDALGWFLPQDVPENVIPYVRQALENYWSGVWFEEFGWK
jgi:ADP-ribose pyrophosphatase YjhB (NUDIX family)